MTRGVVLAVLLLTTALGWPANEPVSKTTHSREKMMTEALKLRCEYLENPLGIDAPRPRLSWQMGDERRGARQSAYQVLVASSSELLAQDRGDVWDSGKVASDESAYVEYAGPALESQRRYYWKVRLWDQDDKPSPYSDAAFWEMGILDRAQWQAQWTGMKADAAQAPDKFEDVQWIWYPEGDPRKEAPKATRYFRIGFDVPADKKVDKAELFLAADDFFTTSINGVEKGSGGGWQAFARIGVEQEIKPGKNIFAVSAVNYAAAAGVAGLLKINFADGSVLRVPTGQAWKCSQELQPHWQEMDFDDSGWKSAMELGKIGVEPWGETKAHNIGGPATYMRKEFQVGKAIKSARVFVTALGSYRLRVNGQRVGKDVFTPDWTDYRKRVSYQTYDVTDLVKQGDNAVAAILGDGWYASGLGWALQRNCFGPPPTRLLCQLRVDYADGTSQTIVSDASWKTSEGAIRRSELYAGETYDARLEQNGWDSPGFNDSSWKPAAVFSSPQPELSAQASPPVRVMDTVNPKSVSNPSQGVYIYDMGQNMVGWVRLKVQGPAGTKVRIRFAEILKPDGNIYFENLRRAEATDTYILKGQGQEVFEPHFTYHGFRYVEITGYPGTPDLDAITGCVAFTSAASSSSFHCSNEMVNKLYHNVVWGQRGNFESVPTDCPQRDERLGWMGDAQIIWRTACFNMDLASFTHKWMRDVIEAQSKEGGFSDVSPRIVADSDGAPAWGDAGVIVPWSAYVQYGDKRLVEKCYPAMQKWMEFIHSANPNLLWLQRRHNDFGDWVPAYDTPTDKDVIATAYWAMDAKYMAQMARAIGREQDAANYEKLFQGIKEAFTRAYVKEDGVVGNGSQTCYLLALSVGLLPQDKVSTAVKLLAQDIEKHDGHLTTGFIGTSYLMPVLSEYGLNDVAYKLLLNEDYPSWGYMIRKGATTIWERWNGDTGDPAMNSYNHYAFGVVEEWMMRHMAGIDTDPKAPGYKRIVIHPYPDKRIENVQAEYESLYGKIASQWKLGAGQSVELNLTIPANTSATVYVPAADATKVKESGKGFEQAEGIKFLKMENGFAVCEVGAGTYHFTSER